MSDIAKDLAVSPTTLRKHAYRHKWTSQRRELSAKGTSAVPYTVRELPGVAANAAQVFVQRSLRESGKLMEHVSRFADNPPAPEKFGELVSALKTLVDIGRQAHRLDERTDTGDLVRLGDVGRARAVAVEVQAVPVQPAALPGPSATGEVQDGDGI